MAKWKDHGCAKSQNTYLQGNDVGLKGGGALDGCGMRAQNEDYSLNNIHSKIRMIKSKRNYFEERKKDKKA